MSRALVGCIANLSFEAWAEETRGEAEETVKQRTAGIGWSCWFSKRPFALLSGNIGPRIQSYFGIRGFSDQSAVRQLTSSLTFRLETSGSKSFSPQNYILSLAKRSRRSSPFPSFPNSSPIIGYRTTHFLPHKNPDLPGVAAVRAHARQLASDSSSFRPPAPPNPQQTGIIPAIPVARRSRSFGSGFPIFLSFAHLSEAGCIIGKERLIGTMVSMEEVMLCYVKKRGLGSLAARGEGEGKVNL